MATPNYIEEQNICDGCGCGVLERDAHHCGNPDDGDFIFCKGCIDPSATAVPGSNGESWIVLNAIGHPLAKDGTVARRPLEGISYGSYAEAAAAAKRFSTL